MSRLRLAIITITLALGGLQAFGQAATPATRAAAWLASQQNANGTWGATDLTPRTTARVVRAESLQGLTSPALASAIGWLTTQGFEANQFLSEQTLALSASDVDTTNTLAHLVQQRSTTTPDFGGFADFNGNAYDSALAVQALATKQNAYAALINSAITTLVAKQNADGGWGLDGGFDSNRVVTAEVVLALTSASSQTVAPAVLTAAQGYLAAGFRADGSVEGDVLKTAVVFRALAYSGYAVASLAANTTSWLNGHQATDGSWSGDAYVTARVLEALASLRGNIVIRDGSFRVTPSTAVAGSTVRVDYTLSNVGATDWFGGDADLHLGSATGAVLASQSLLFNFARGTDAPFSFTIPTTGMSGPVTLVLVMDSSRDTDQRELRTDDNVATTTFRVSGRPDLLVSNNDISVSPARPQPGQATTVALSVHNIGEAAAANVTWTITDAPEGSSPAVIQSGTIASIAPGGTATVSVPRTFSGGTHALTATVDGSNTIDEANEQNNRGVQTLFVRAASSIDLRVSSVIATPARPATGQTTSIRVRVDNSGVDAAESTLRLYDGVPGAGGVTIAELPLVLGGGGADQVEFDYVVTSSSRVIYAVADAANALPEMDETNNSGYALLTDAYADLTIAGDGIALPTAPLHANDTVTARVVVRNLGSVAVSHAEVVVYDDLPQSGGNEVQRAFVDVPANGRAVVAASWPARAGQHFVTAVVNPSNAVAEVDVTNNRSTRRYAVAGDGPNLALDGTPASAIDRNSLRIDPITLAVSGSVRLNLLTPATVPFLVTVFDDVDGDLAFNPEVDVPLGTALVQPGAAAQMVFVVVQGSLRYVPGHLVAAIDSGNAVAESDESDNNIDLRGAACSGAPSASFAPSRKWQSPIGSYVLGATARVTDSNGDDVVDGNDAPTVVVASGGVVAALRGDTGAELWHSGPLDAGGHQSNPLIADVDGDGKAEIIVHLSDGSSHRMVCLRGDGTVKWTSPDLARDAKWDLYAGLAGYSYLGAPIAADLDGDGHAEVIVGRNVLNGADGTIRWIGTGGSGRAWYTADDHLYDEHFPDQEAPIAVDLDGDGRLELVAGNTAYRADGSILWQRMDLSDGFTAPVIVAGDARPKICLVGQGSITMLNADGTTFWPSRAIPGGAMLGGAPTVFMDGGSGPWIGVAGDGNYSVLNASTGEVRWTVTTTTDLSFGIATTNAATAFDFGAGEVLVYAARHDLLVLRASDGAVVYTTPIEERQFSATNPAIADVDGDGHADIVVPNRDGVFVLSDRTSSGTPSIFNEVAHHAVNVGDEYGRIPQHEMPTAASAVNYRTNLTIRNASIPLPNLTASYLRGDTSSFPSSASLTARIANNGLAPADPVKVAFYRRDGTTVTLAGVRTTGVIVPGRYEDLTLAMSSPAAGTTTYFAVADDDGSGRGTLAECDESDNTSAALSLKLSADLAVESGTLTVSDAVPRIGDTIRFTAVADVSGAVDPALLRAQFYSGDPAAGGIAISPLVVPQIIGGAHRVAVARFDWMASAPTGGRQIFVVFDPESRISEDDETNNAGTYLLNVTSATPQPALAGTLTLTPPTGEAGVPVAVQLLLQNSGNVPLAATALQYEARNAAGALFASGNATLAPLAKGLFGSLSFGNFVPSANDDYTVTITSSDATLALQISPKTVHVAPFAAAELSVVPSRIPVSLPMIQAHAHVSRTNTIVLPDDPLLPLVKAHLQRAIDWLQPQLRQELTNSACLSCHFTAPGFSALERSRDVSGISVDAALSKDLFDMFARTQSSDGYWSGVPKSSSVIGGWAVGQWHDGAQAKPYVLRAADFAIARSQQPDGQFTCDTCLISFGNPEAMTMFGVMQMARAYELSGDEKYRTALRRAASWEMSWNLAARAPQGVEYPARVAIGLANAIPFLDAGDVAPAKQRLAELAAYLRSQQNSDGSFGTTSSLPSPVVRTAQSLYALSLAGARGDDAQLRAGLVWLMNMQSANGFWNENPNQVRALEFVDETTWCSIVLPAVFARLGQFDVDVKVTIPSTAELVSTSNTPLTTNIVAAGKEVVWRLPELTEAGTDLYFNVRLNGIQDGEMRPAVASASLAYTQPSTGAMVNRPFAIPNVTAFAPLALQLSTDAASYGPNSNVTITEKVTNTASSGRNLTTDLAIRDNAGTTVATIAANEPVTSLVPSVPFAGWHYGLPVTVPVARGDANRYVSLPIDFRTHLTALGAGASTFDPHSIRVSLDAAPESELWFVWAPTGASSAAGTLAVELPDSVSPGNVPLHVWFDVAENGFKPVSAFDRAAWGGRGSGYNAVYYLLDRVRGVSAASPEALAIVQPPIRIVNQTTLNLGGAFKPSGVPDTYWAMESTFYLRVETAGTYAFHMDVYSVGWLDIDGQRVINYYGDGAIALTPGYHKVHLVYGHGDFGYLLAITWAPPGSGFIDIPEAAIFPSLPANDSAPLFGAPIAAGVAPSSSRTFVWNTGLSSAGPYTVAATVRQNGAFVASASTPFSINAVAPVAASIVTDKPSYDARQPIHAVGTIDLAAGNAVLSNLSALVSITGTDGGVLASAATPIASLIPGQSARAILDTSTGTLPPGTWKATLTVTNGSGAAIATASVPFTVRSTAVTGAGITGTLSAPASVAIGDDLSTVATLTNDGNAAIANGPFVLTIVDPATQAAITSTPFTATIAAGASSSRTTAVPTTALVEGSYDVVLTQMIAGTPVSLARASFRATPAHTIITASISTARAFYDANEVVRVAASALYAGGSGSLSGLHATVTIADLTGAVVATRVTPIPTFVIGQSIDLSTDWNAGTSAPGSYSARVVVADSAEAMLAEASTNFSIRSSALSGAGLAGTISAPTIVTANDVAPLSVAIVNGGNAAVVDGSFRVRIAGPDGAVVATLPLTLSVAKGATATSTLTWSANVPPQTYTATLESLVVGTPASLATTSVEVRPVPTIVQTTISSPATNYAPGQTVHAAATVQYVSGAAPLANVTAAFTVTDGANAVIAGSTAAVGTLVPGQSVNASSDWTIASTTPPGAYTISVAIRDGDGVALATSSTTVTVTSTAVTGQGITGTLAAPATIVEGQPLTVAATLRDGGNAPLANAPFVVQLIDPSTTTVVATQSLSVTVNVGSSFTTNVTFATTGIAPHAYDVVLISRITATASTLASTSVLVQPQAASAVATIATDRAAYDALTTVHASAVVTNASASSTLTNLSATMTIANAAGADLATSTAAITSLAAGATIPLTLDWNDGTSAPGPYAARVAVRDATGVQLALASASFTILSTATTGTGVRGTIGAPASFSEGSPISFAVQVTNGGNAALTNAPLAVQLFALPSQELATTLPFPITAAAGATISTTVATTEHLAPRSYKAVLVSLVTGAPITLGNTTFDIRPLPLALDVSISTKPRVLLWVNCSPGNSGKSCTPPVPPFLTTTLTNAAIPWTLVGDERSFLAAMRTGAYSIAVVDAPQSAELSISDEFLELVRNGYGLLYLDNTSDMNPKLAPVLGVAFGGTVKNATTSVDLLSTPFSAAGSIVFNGDSVALRLGTAQVAARVAATQAPALTWNEFGRGRAAVLPFDVEKTPSSDVARLLVSLAGFLSRTSSTDARSVVPLDIAVSTPAGGASNYVVTVTLPTAMTAVAASPQLTTASPVSWTANIPAGTTLHLTLWVRLPETIGTATVSVAAGLPSQLPLVTKTFALNVTADRAAIEAALAADLTALRSVIAASDRRALDDALSDLDFARSAATTSASAVIDHLLDLSARLQSIAAPTATARTDAGRLLGWWQSRGAN